MPKISVVIPAYNQERIIDDTIISALAQSFQNKEIIVVDDNSTDGTLNAVTKYPITVFHNNKNLGLSANLDVCVERSKGEIIVILCGDDCFTHSMVLNDIVAAFDCNQELGVLGRYYFQYLDGYPGAVMTIRGDIFTSSCQPSGIAFRRKAIQGKFPNKLFVEVPGMVKKIIDANWKWSMLKYDTIAARLHPGVKGNAATNPGYYRSGQGQSPTQNWYEVLGYPIGMYLGFIQLKNRASWMLWPEIKTTVKLDKKCLLNLGFWLCALVALIVPGSILRPLANFYRHRITRHFVRVIHRSECYAHS